MSLYNFIGGGLLGDPCATAITLWEVGRGKYVGEVIEAGRREL